MRKIAAFLAALILSSGSAWAANCSSYPYTLTNGTTADANQVMLNFNNILNCANTLANAPINTNITQLAGLTSPIPPSLGGTSLYNSTSATTGSANAQQLSSPSPSGFTLLTGNVVLFQVGSGLTNTGSTQLSVNGTAFTTIEKRTAGGLQALSPGDLQAGQFYMVGYDGTQYELLTQQAANGGIGTVASAATTDLGTVPNEVVKVTGTTTITSFGSSATIGAIKFITFAGSLTLSYNATSMILPGVSNIVTATNDFALAEYLGSGNWQVLSYVPASNRGGRFLDTQLFTTNGTYTPVAGMGSAWIYVLGGGGSGGGCANSSGHVSAGGGGGGGGAGIGFATAAQIGASQTVTVGSGASAPSAGNNNGNQGGSTAVGTLITASGGFGGIGSPSGSNGALGGGLPGTAGGTLNPIQLMTQDGGFSIFANAASATFTVGGPGGSTFFGPGAGPNTSTNSNGLNGGANGGGGAGANCNNSATNYAGGAGGNGLVLIYEFSAN